MTFKHYINGVEIEEPNGFESYIQEIVRDDQERVIRYNFPLDLTFIGDGYEIIEAQYQENFNSELEYRVIRIDGNVSTIEAIGIIKMSNCEFNLTAKPKPSVNVEIDDNVFQSYIFSNKKRPSAVTTKTSLNNVPILPASELQVNVFNSVTGLELSTPRVMYDAIDCLRHTIDFMSDGKIGFVSDWYTNLPSNEKLAITTGAALRLPSGGVPITPPIVNFGELFGELSKLYNLYFIVEGVLTPKPTLRLETEEYLYGSTLVLDIVNNDEIIRSIDYDKLYNRISVGGDADRVYGTQYPMFYTPVLTFNQETYNITGFIGVDNELDLASKYVIDSNEIHKTVIGATTSNDNKTFLIQYNQATLMSTKGAWFPGDNTDYRYYNEQLTNLNVLSRYKYLGDVVLSLGDLSASFLVSGGGYNRQLTMMSGIYGLPYDFTDDSTPPNFNNGAFDLSTDRFTALSSGVFRLGFEMSITCISLTAPSFVDSIFYLTKMQFLKNGTDLVIPDTMTIKKSNIYGTSTETLPQDASGVGQSASFGDTFLHTVFYSFELNAGDYVDARLSITAPFADIATESTFRFNRVSFRDMASPLNSGEFESGSPDEYKLIVYSTPNEGIIKTDWDALQSNPVGLIQIDTGKNDKRITHVKKISRNIVTGESDIQLIASRNQTFK